MNRPSSNGIKTAGYELNLYLSVHRKNTFKKVFLMNYMSSLFYLQTNYDSFYYEKNHVILNMQHCNHNVSIAKTTLYLFLKYFGIFYAKMLFIMIINIEYFE